MTGKIEEALENVIVNSEENARFSTFQVTDEESV